MSRCRPWCDATKVAIHRLRWQLSTLSSPTTEGDLSLCIDNISKDTEQLLDRKYENWDQPHYVRQNILLNITLKVKKGEYLLGGRVHQQHHHQY